MKVTHLVEAAREEHEEMVALLLSERANVNAKPTKVFQKF